MPVASLEDTYIGKTFGDYAQKILKDRLYFFTDSDVHFKNWPKLLLGDITRFKKVINDSDFDIASRELAEAYFQMSKKFLILHLMRSDFLGYAVTLPEKEAKAREALQKLNYEIIR